MRWSNWLFETRISRYSTMPKVLTEIVDFDKIHLGLGNTAHNDEGQSLIGEHIAVFSFQADTSSETEVRYEEFILKNIESISG